MSDVAVLRVEHSGATLSEQRTDRRNDGREQAEANNRFPYLDGLRGIASVAVFLWHNFLSFFPGAVSPDIPLRSRLLEVTVFQSPLNLLFAGDFAVYIFFVLSGFVISIKHFRGNYSNALKSSFLRRYVRLMPPAIVTILVSYAILKCGLMYNNAAAQLTKSWWLTLNWRDVNVDLRNALWMGLYGMWSRGISASEQFNSNLGTLFIELLGSLIIFAFILLVNNLSLGFRDRCFCYLALITSSFYLAFGQLH